MTIIIKYLKLAGYTILSILGTILLLTILNYFNLISDTVISYLKFIIVLLITFIGGMKMGSNTEQKGWLSGLKLGLILIFILFIFTYLGLEKSITIKNIIYYIIILLITMLGSMIGINKKKQTT